MQSILIFVIMPLTYILSFLYAAYIRKFIFCEVITKRYIISMYLLLIILTLIDDAISFLPKDNILGLIASFILYFLFTPFAISLVNSFFLLSLFIRLILNLAVLYISLPIMLKAYMIIFSI